MPYQSFGSEKGDSDSPAKLAALKLPDDLSGKRVLDLGCAEGYFCQEALRRGATEVVGIDRNGTAILEAMKRVPQANFIQGDWWDITGRNFDVVLFLSGIHYESRQKEFLDFIRTRLNNEGLLILECGVQWNIAVKEWKPVQRHNGIIKFPTFRLLVEDLLSSYATRDIGPSIPQVGDPMTRHVFHCRPLKPTILILGGKSKRGKTVLARELGRTGSPVLYMDFLLGSLRAQARNFNHPFIAYLIEHFEQNRVDIFCNKLIKDNMKNEFLSFLSYLVSSEERVTILEGYIFETDEMRQAAKAFFEKRGFVVAEVQL